MEHNQDTNALDESKVIANPSINISCDSTNHSSFQFGEYLENVLKGTSITVVRTTLRKGAQKYPKFLYDWKSLIREYLDSSDLDTVKTSSKQRISKAPGTSLIVFVDFLYSPKTVEQTFNPLVADWRYEYFEALRLDRKWKARWISVRYRYRFILVMGLSKVFSMLKQLKLVSK